MTVTDKYLLYALERGTFWAYLGIGYTPFVEVANRYSLAGAKEISDASKRFWTPEQGYVSAPDIVVPEGLTSSGRWSRDTAAVLQELVDVQLPAWPFPIAEMLHIRQGRTSFTCPRCEYTSHNPEDVSYGYCGACHEFTGETYGFLPADKQ